MNCEFCNKPGCLEQDCHRKEIRKSKVKELITISKEWYEMDRLGLHDLKEYRDLEIQVINLREELQKDKENEP